MTADSSPCSQNKRNALPWAKQDWELAASDSSRQQAAAGSSMQRRAAKSAASAVATVAEAAAAAAAAMGIADERADAGSEVGGSTDRRKELFETFYNSQSSNDKCNNNISKQVWGNLFREPKLSKQFWENFFENPNF